MFLELVAICFVCVCLCVCFIKQTRILAEIMRHRTLDANTSGWVDWNTLRSRVKSNPSAQEFRLAPSEQLEANILLRLSPAVWWTWHLVSRIF